MTTLAQHWAGRPLAIRPESLAALMHASPDASRFVGMRSGDSANRVTPGGTAVITIEGPLVNRGMIVGENWGLNSFEGLAFKIAQAGKDPKVRAIVLDFDSPGGEAAGSFELAGLVRKVSAVKPVYAFAGGLCCSAAYAIASGARAIVAMPSALVGSIGVVLMHADYSRAIDEAGITPTLIHAGANKIDGNPYQPLSKDVRADLQSDVDKFHGLFLKTVAAGRGSRLSADAAKKTEARTYLGEDARKVGLVDEIGSFSELLAAIERRAA